MTIVEILYHPFAIPFRAALPTTHGALAIREGALVEVVTSEGIVGWGEIAPLPTFGGDDLATTLAALPAISGALRGWQITDALAALRDTPALPSSTVYGLETALLDAQGQCSGVSIAQLLASKHMQPRSAIAVNAVVGATSLDQAVNSSKVALAAGFRCIKLKMGGGQQEEIERVAAVRAVIGPEIHLRLDANEGWSFAQAVTILKACERYDIQYIEQPLKSADLAGMHQLRHEVAIAIAADEAVIGFGSARRVLEQEAADVLIIKPQLSGGLRASQRLIHEATERGIQCVITSSMESGVGVAAALHLAAASPEITLECGLATLGLLIDDLIVESMEIHQGRLDLPARAGLGVQVDRAALARYAHNPSRARGIK